MRDCGSLTWLRKLNSAGQAQVTIDDTRLSSIELAREGLRILLTLLSPITPHMTHELWIGLNYGDDVLGAAWPEVDTAALVQDNIEMVVQVNGKMRAKLAVSVDASKQDIEAMALADVNVQRFIKGQAIKKLIVVPGRLVSIVV